MCESSHDYFRTREGFFFYYYYCRECYESIGSNQADALVGFHVSTECDIIGRFLGKSKALRWNTLKSSSQEDLRTLSALDDDETLPSASVLEGTT